MRRLTRAAIVALALFGLVVPSACRRGDVEPTHSPPGLLDAEAGAPHDASIEAPTSGIRLRPALADPRLSAVRAALRKRDARGAAVAAEETATRSGLSPEDSCAFSHVSGRLHAAASDPRGAIAAFTRASDPACPLASYAKLGAARSALAARGFAEAVTLTAGLLPSGLAAEDDVRMVRADALSLVATPESRAEAIPLWQKVIEGAPKGPHWVEAAGRLSSALADRADGKADPDARAAYALATRVLLESPHRAETFGAKATRARTAAWLKLPVELSIEERLAEARGSLESGEATRALGLAQAVFGDARVDAKSACGAYLVRAQATAKTAKSAPQADAWGDAIGKCDADPELVTALFAGGKASASAKRPQEALFRFAEVERRFADHRLADDAALRAAAIMDDQGDHVQAREKLARIASLYPAGDMRGEGLFRAALMALRAGDSAQAATWLTEIDTFFPDDRHWGTAGRATFFRARLLERAGDTKGAHALDAEAVARAPLSFYMARSYARVAESDPEGARGMLASLLDRDKKGTFAEASAEVLASAPFRRAVALLEVGDVDSARRELVLAGALGEGAAPELVWTCGDLFDRAEAWDVGHGVSRGRVKDHLAHVPEGPYRRLWETAYPRAYPEEVTHATSTYAVAPSLVWGIMREESSFIVDVRSPANAYGLMQLIPATAKWISAGTVTQEAELKRAEVSVDLGTKLLAQLLTTHKHPALAIAAYNAGSGAVSRWVAARGGDDLEMFVEEIPYEETRNYVKRVLGSMAAYAYLYDRPHLDDVLRLPSKVTH